jgi:hypothetical protein
MEGWSRLRCVGSLPLSALVLIQRPATRPNEMHRVCVPLRVCASPNQPTNASSFDVLLIDMYCCAARSSVFLVCLIQKTSTSKYPTRCPSSPTYRSMCVPISYCLPTLPLTDWIGLVWFGLDWLHAQIPKHPQSSTSECQRSGRVDTHNAWYWRRRWRRQSTSTTHHATIARR